MSKYAHKVRKPYPTLYHISFNEELQGVWQPKSPDGDYDDSGDDALYGEPTTPRISLSPSVEQAFQAVYANVKHLFDKYPYLIFFVYQPVFKGTERIVDPGQFSKHRLVHDAHITEEHSVLDPLKMALLSRVKIHKPNDKNRVNYYAFNVKANEYYGWLPGQINAEWMSLESRSSVAWLNW